MFLCKLGKERREPRVRARTGNIILLINKSELVNKIMHKISAKYKFVE
jgi:hypothetical protein